MRLVATLVAPAEQSNLDFGLVQSQQEILQRHGAEVSALDWLSEGEACDLFFEGLSLEDARPLLTEGLAGEDIDCAVQPTKGRRKKLLIADMESTIIGQEMIDELAETLGIGAQIAEITARAMRGELEFEDSLRERVALIKGVSEKTLHELSNLMVLNPGARSLVRTMRTHGAYTALVSGGFTFFTGQIREACSFHEDRANLLEIEGGKLTGKVKEPILGRQAKRETTEELSRKLGIGLDEVVAVGDGANDLAMLTAVGMGVAYHGKPVVREATPYQVNHTDHHALLFYQGYKRSEFID